MKVTKHIERYSCNQHNCNEYSMYKIDLGVSVYYLCYGHMSELVAGVKKVDDEIKQEVEKINMNNCEKCKHTFESKLPKVTPKEVLYKILELNINDDLTESLGKCKGVCNYIELGIWKDVQCE